MIEDTSVNECIFCRISSGDVPADVVAEGDDWVAFRDLEPKAPTHVLVIPRRHVESLDTLSEAGGEDGAVLLEACRMVARLTGLAGGYRVVTNVGSDGGQSVGHLHFHVLGGRQMGWPLG